MKEAEVTLLEVLQFREKKAMIQDQLLSSELKGIVVSLGMNIPGPIKSSPSIYQAFLEGKKQLEQIFFMNHGKIEVKQVLQEKAGYAAIYLVSGIDKQLMKKRCVSLEETHILGRILDIDVWKEDKTALTRSQVGAPARKCFICNQDAKNCGRNRTHTVQELQTKVLEWIEYWKAGVIS